MAPLPLLDMDEPCQCKAAEAARILDIEHSLCKCRSQFSGGQLQRVAIGCAIVQNPVVLLFHEPLSSLDAAPRMDMRFESANLTSSLGFSL